MLPGKRGLWFLLNVILIIAATGLCIFSIVRLCFNLQDWKFSLLLLSIGIVTGIFSVALYIYRKSKSPLPGIDYK